MFTEKLVQLTCRLESLFQLCQTAVFPKVFTTFLIFLEIANFSLYQVDLMQQTGELVRNIADGRVKTQTDLCL